MFADDATIFETPNKNDITYLASILENLKNVTGLTNCTKIQVAHIH
jgi:hypothetical protein